jgi:hypothetical protein
MGAYDLPFWNYIDASEFRVQRCDDCGRYRFPPAPCCDQCLSPRFEWSAVSTQGQVRSWVTFHRQYFPSMPPPYTVILAELAEGVVIPADLDGTPEGLRIDKSTVSLTFEEASFADGTEGKLYRWRPDG